MTDLQLHLVSAHYTTIDASWNARDVRTTFWRFYINNRDGAAIWYRGSRYALPAGQMHLIPAYVKFSCHNTYAIGHIYAHFDLLGVTPLLQQQLFPVPFSLPLTPDASGLYELFGQGRIPETCPVSMCLTHAVILHAMSEAIARLSETDRARLQAAFVGPNPIRNALQLIEQHLQHRVSVNDMAAACALSPDHFTRRFRQMMGETPSQYALQRRLSHAARQLLYGQASIDTIAQAHGFANRFHFTRAFTREIGITPAAYRKIQDV